MVGRVIIISAFVYLALHIKAVLILAGLLMFGFNVAHGSAKWPADYYRKSKGPISPLKKINPLWWTLNDDDPVYPIPADGSSVKNDWFYPEWPQWRRAIGWWWRNPTNNFDRYVMGFWDKQDWWARERHLRDAGEYGEMWPYPDKRWAVCMPFISYSWKGLQFYIGWKPNGEFGWFSLRRK